MNPLISIVIPVYNVADYVEKCLKSCFNQDFPQDKYEVIIVNDGSTDSSLKVCERLQNVLPPYLIFTQENKGLSGARNTGLKHARGEYVWFVDSDDWIMPDSLRWIVESISAYQPDLLWMGHQVSYQNSISSRYIPEQIDRPISGEDFFRDHLKNLFFIWKFVYKKSFLLDNDLEFLEGIYYEDLEFTPRALAAVQSCMTLPIVTYTYLIREGSIVNKVRAKHITDRFNILCKLELMTREPRVSQGFSYVLSNSIVKSFCGTVKMAARTGHDLPNNAIELQELLKKSPKVPFKSSLDYKLMAFNLLKFHSVYKWVYAVVKSKRFHS